MIVIGFDSLDGSGINRYDTPNLDALEESATMQTFQGLEPSELATTVLWSSMLAGEHPKSLYPEYYSSESTFNPWLEGKWEYSLLNSFPVRKAEGFLVRRMTSVLSRERQEKLRAKVRDQLGKQSFVANRLADTHSLLDAAKSPRLISIPGINFDSSNKALKGRLDISSGHDLSDATTAERFERDAIQADADRLIRTLYAIRSREHDLVVSHFFCLDLIQHLWATSEELMQRWYGLYDHFLSQIQSIVSEDDTVVVVSDHGMEDEGIHSKRAFFAASKPLWDSQPYRMEDLSAVLTAELESGNHSIADTEKPKQQGVSDEVTQHLEDLGYF